MNARSRSRLGAVAALIITLGCGVRLAEAQSTVTLSAATSPATAQAATHTVSVTGSNFPAGTIAPSSVTLSLEPATPGAGPTATTTALAVTTVVATSRRVSFQIPASIAVTSSTPYRVSLAGSTSTGGQFVSGNKASLTVDPPAQILSLTPSSVVPGQTVAVTITTRYTNFVQGSTRASFGPGTSVGGGPEGGVGLVTVTSPTTATASVAVSAGAAGGLQRVEVRTGVQQARLDNVFKVETPNRPPTAAAGGPYTGTIGQQIAFSGSGTDPDGDELTLTWDFGDAATATGAAPSHTYATAGVFTVTLTVTDGRNGTATSTATATIESVDRSAPVVALTAPREVLPGSTVTVSAQATDNVGVQSVTFDVTGGGSSIVLTPPFERVITVPSVAAVGDQIRVTASARDASGNVTSTEAVLTIVALPDNEAPAVTLNAPGEAAPGTVLNLSASASDNVGVSAVVFLLGGDVIRRDTDPAYEATYSIAADALVGSSLTFTARAEDYGGNATEAQRTVRIVQAPDTTPPTVTLTAPADVVVGGTLRLSASAADAGGLAGVTFIINGVPVLTDTEPAYETDYRLGPDITAGSVLRIEARARDFAGLETTDVRQTRVVPAPAIVRGVIAGVVYDDTTGLPIQGAIAQLQSLDGTPVTSPLPQALSDARGRFRLPSRPGLARLGISKPGFTEADRTVMVVEGTRTDPLDARLTPHDSRSNVISALTGGIASSERGDVGFVVAPGALGDDRVLRVTPVSAQGLIGRLPLGWSPVAAVDVAPPGLPFSVPATVSLSAPPDVPATSALVLARWDAVTRAWVIAADATRTPDGRIITADIVSTGQYVVLLGDAAPNAPPAAVVGHAVPGVLSNPPPSAVSVFITPSPKVLFSQPGAHSNIGVLAVPSSRLPSGHPFRLDLSEAYDVDGGARLLPEDAGQDLTLHSFGGGAPLTLGSQFIVTPSRVFAPLALGSGVVDLAVTMPADRGGPRGVVIGAAGGVATVADVQLAVPPGAATEDLPVLLSPLDAAQLRAAVPGALAFVGGVRLDVHGGTFTAPARLSMAAPPGLPAGAQVLVVQLVEAAGTSHLALVAVGAVQGSELVAVTDPLGNGSLPLSGIRGEGRFAFLRANVPVAFVTGTVLGVGGQPLAGALVTLDTLGIAAISDAAGRYVVAAPLGDVRVTALDPATRDVVTATRALTTAGAVTSVALGVETTAPTVVAVAPASGALDVPFTSAVTVTLSEPLDGASLGSDALVVRKAGVPVAGTVSLAPGGRTLTFRPNTLLESETTYQVTVAGSIRDLAGNALGAPFVSQFTTLDLTAPPRPAAGTIVARIPDATGRSVVTGTQGTAEPGGRVSVKNLRTGAITTLTPDADGSFSGHVAAARADKLELSIIDAAGNATALPLPAFRDADGSVVVGADGGRVEGAGGVVVDIPAGAFPDGTVVRVEPVAQAALPLAPPRHTRLMGAVRLDTGGVKPRVALDLSVPAAPDASAADQVLVLRSVQLPRRLAWTLADRAHLVDGRYTTASPPFQGILAPDSTYAFARFDSEIITAGSNGTLDSVLASPSDDKIETRLGLGRLISPGGNGVLESSAVGDDVVRRDCLSYVAINTSFPSTTLWTFSSLSTALPVVVVADPAVNVVVLPAVCNTELDVQVRDPNTEEIVRSITQRAPPTADEIFFPPNLLVTADAVRPLVVWSNVPTPGRIDHVEVVFNEPMDAASVTARLAIKDAAGTPVAGAVQLLLADTLAVFTPTGPFRLGEPYSVVLDGVTDKAGNPVQASPIAFKPFKPFSLRRLGEGDAGPAMLDAEQLKRALEKCLPTGLCSTGVRDVAVIGTTLFLANGRQLVEQQFSDPENPARLVVVDVTDARQPRLIGFNRTATNPRAVIAMAGVGFAGLARDLLLVAGGGREPGGELDGKLEIYDVTACTQRPVPVANCLDPALTPLKGVKFLSTAAGTQPRPGVPAAAGIPLQIAAIQQPGAPPADEVALAFITTTPVALEAIDATRSINLPLVPGAAVGPDGVVFGEFLDVGVLKTRVLGIEQNPATGEFFLGIFSPQLSRVTTIPLPGPAARVAAFENVVFDVDRDGRLGEAENTDGDDGVSATDEIFDFAVVSSGPISDAARCQQLFGMTDPSAAGAGSVPVPCGALYVIDLSSFTSLGHPDPPSLAQIPLPGSPFSLQVDSERRLAYVELRGHGLAFVDLSRSSGPGLLDADGDRVDDRLLGIFEKSDISMGELKLDRGRGIAYASGAVSGVELVCVDGVKCGDPVERLVVASAKVDTVTYPSSDGSTVTVLVTPEAWRTSQQTCFRVDVPPGATVRYRVQEFPLLSDRTMLDLSNGRDTGTISAGTPEICLPTRPAEPFPLASLAQVDISRLDGSLVKQILLRLTPLMVMAEDVRVASEFDRVNAEACTVGGTLTFQLLHAASVTVRIDGTVVESNVPRAAGVHEIPVSTDMVSLPGAHEFTITAVSSATGPTITTTTTGAIFHDVTLNASFPVAHTMVKGVDIVDGHLTHSTEDVRIPGRGLSLSLGRSYSSEGNESRGPLGAGWTHSYNSMLVANGCGRFVVVGGEGSGNGFTATANGFRPQLGYHSTLVRDPEDSSKFDFFTKARVRHHFERELAMPGEVYTLRFIEEPNGNRLTLDYLAGDANPRTLDSVTDSSGRALVFEYRKIFHADRIVRVTGRNSVNDGTLLGLQIVYDYDDVGNLVTATRTSPNPGAGLGDERVERYTYSSSRLEDRHNLLTYTDANGNTTTYAYYDAADSIAGVETFGLGAENFAGKKHEIVRAIQEPEGVTTRFGYDFLTKTRTVTDPRSEDPQDPAPPPPTRYVLNDYGATVRIEAPLGKTTVMQWCTDAPHPACPDPEGRPGRDALMISMTDAEGRTHQYEYADGRGNLTKETIRFSASKAPVTTADGVTPVAEVTTVTAYDPTFSRAVSKTDAEGRTTVFLVDADYPGRPTFCPDGSPGRSTGNLLGMRDAAGNVTCYAYAANGDLTHVTDPRNFVTALTTYDPYGNAEQIVDPVGNVTTKSFDERSREVEMRDTFRHHTRFAYDGLDRPIREERLDDLGSGGAPQIVERRHRAGGELVRETDGLGQVTTYTYDGMNRLRRRRDEGVRQSDGTVAALETTLAYDRSGNQTGMTDPRGVTRTHAYDALGRRVETRVAGPFGASQVESSSTYDLAGNRVTETDLHGHRTTLVYDGLYRVVATELPFTHAFIELPAAGAARIRTAYDRVGNKVLETDANGHPMTFAYDAISRMIRKTDANGNIVAYTYDAAGNLTSESNLTTGLVNEFLEFDGRNRVTRKRQTVRLGAVGSATAVYATTIEYRDAENATVLTNPRGFRMRVARDGLDRVFRGVVDVDGLALTTTYRYDGNGNLAGVEDPEGGDVDVTHEYDGLNRKIRSVYVSTADDAGPVTEEWVYDGNGNVVRFKDRRGVVSGATYDNLNRPLTRLLVESISNNGAVLTTRAYQYHDAVNAVTETDANGNATTTHLDGLHRPRLIDDPDPNGGVVVNEHDGTKLRSTVDKKGQRREYRYDPLSRLVATREFDAGGALGTTLSIEYADAQNQIRATDRRGTVTIRQLDALGRLLQRRRAGADLASRYGAAEVLLEAFEYDGNGNQTAIVDALGNRSLSSFDGADRRVATTVGAGSAVAATTTWTYDGAGNMLTMKDGRAHGGPFDVRHSYDARYRKVAATNGALETTTYGYDAGDNVVRMTEPKGPAFTTTYVYDEQNQVLAVDESSRADGTTAAGVTRFVYDGNRNRIAQQDANGSLVTYRFDSLNRMTDTLQHTVRGAIGPGASRGADPRGGGLAAGGDEASALRWRQAYDRNSNAELVIDALGQRVEMTYDHLDRITLKTYRAHAQPDLDFQMDSVQYAYDGNSNLLGMVEVKRFAGGVVTERTERVFDALDRVQSRTHFDRGDAVGKRVTYTYDVEGNRIGHVDPDGVATTYAYDARNRLAAVTTPAGVTRYAWWEDDLLKRVELPNGVVHDRSQPDAYDAADRVTAIANGPAAGPAYSAYRYSYDGNGNRAAQTDTQRALGGGLGETTTYSYDSVNRLRTVTYGARGQLAYSYDAVGNRLSERGIDPRTAASVDRSYRYQALPESPDRTFDQVNTLTQIVDNLDPSRTVTYDYDRNLNQVAMTRAGARSDFRFGIRDELLAVQPDGAAAVRFDYDGDKLRVKKIAPGGSETRYFYDDDSVLVEYSGSAGLSTVRKYDYGHELLSLTEVPPSGARQSQFYLTDALRSTANLTAAGGELLHSYRYDAWGRVLDEAGTSDNPRQLTGHYRDEETGLHYFGARYYDEETGRFLSQDPYLGEASVPLSLHRYLYAFSNPLAFVDLHGYEAVEQTGRNSWWQSAKKRLNDKVAYAGYQAQNVGELVEWNATEHIPGIFKGAHDQAKRAAGETLLTAADVAFAGLKWALPADARQRVEESDMNRAMSGAGRRLQQGATIPELVVEGLTGTVMAPIEFFRTVADPHASSEDMGARLFDMVASVEAGAGMVGGIRTLAGGAAFVREVATAGLDSGLQLARRVNVTAKLINHRRTTTLLRYELREGATIAGPGRISSFKVERPLTLGDAWTIAGHCAQVPRCGFSGGLTEPSIVNAFKNLVARRSGGSWLDPHLQKWKGDLDFHLDRPGATATDWQLADLLNDQVSSPMFDMTRDHGVLTFQMTREVMGGNTPFGQKLMEIIRRRNPEFIGKDGLVRADLYLKRGVYLTGKDLLELQGFGPQQSVGRKALIFKHGHQPVLRDPQEFYVY